MAAIANDWLAPMSGEFKKPYYRKLYETVKSEYETKEVYPAPDDIFNAFAFTPLSKVKVVILGQDPYHQPGHLCHPGRCPLRADRLGGRGQGAGRQWAAVLYCQ